jgi:hypothetical protein
MAIVLPEGVERVFRVSFDFKVHLREPKIEGKALSREENAMSARAKAVREGKLMRFLLENPDQAGKVMRELALEEVAVRLDEQLIGYLAEGAEGVEAGAEGAEGDKVIPLVQAIMDAPLSGEDKMLLIRDYASGGGLRHFFEGVVVDIVGGSVEGI